MAYLRALINQRAAAMKVGSVSLGVKMPRAVVIIDDFNEVIAEDDDFELVTTLMGWVGASVSMFCLSDSMSTRSAVHNF